MTVETKQTPPLSPPLAKVAAEFSLSGNVFNFQLFECSQSCEGRRTMNVDPMPTTDSTHTRP